MSQIICFIVIISYSFFHSNILALDITPICTNRKSFEPYHSVLFNISAFPNFNSCLNLVRSISQPAHRTWSNITNLLSKSSANNPVRILVVGGSATRGADCDDGINKGVSCSWSSRLVSWIRKSFPFMYVELDNQAIGGLTTQAALALLSHWVSSDIILLDFIDNDSADFRGNLIPIYESFISQIKIKQPNANIIFIVSCANDGCGTVKNVIFWTSSTFSIPVISFYDLAHCSAHLDGEEKYDSTLNLFWGNTNHPNWRIHQLIADTIAYTLFYNSFITTCSNNASTSSPLFISNNVDVDKYRICQKPSSFYNAQQYIKSNYNSSDIIAHNWLLLSDRIDKPGWISQSRNSSISFLCHFGKEPRLLVTYLRSYKGLSNVTMSLNGISIELQGIYTKNEQTQKVSQAYMKTFIVSNTLPFTNFENAFGFQVKTNSTLYVKFSTVTTIPFKFKILSISSC